MNMQQSILLCQMVNDSDHAGSSLDFRIKFRKILGAIVRHVISKQ